MLSMMAKLSMMSMLSMMAKLSMMPMLSKWLSAESVNTLPGYGQPS